MNLAESRCQPCEGKTAALDRATATALLAQVDARWSLNADATRLQAAFEFRNYFRTLAFVNAVAYIAIREDHHPQIDFDYKTCRMQWWTHAIGGLSDNDFIGAAKVDALLKD